MKLFFLALPLLLLQGCYVGLWPQRASETVARDVVESEYAATNRPVYEGNSSSRITPEARQHLNEQLDELRRQGEEARYRDIERENDRLRDQLRRRGPFGLVAVSNTASSMESRIARTYGISKRAARNLLTLLGQSLAGDSRSLEVMGLDQYALERAVQNGGRLTSEELKIASKAIGMPAAKLDALVRRIVIRE